MHRHRSATSRFHRRILLVLSLLALAMAPLLPAQAVAQQAPDTEVIAVEDITAESNCMLTTEDYADKAETQLLESRTYPCPPGSVLHAERMPRDRAEALGLRHVISSGVPAVDEAAVDALKQEILSELGVAITGGDRTASATTASGECGTVYYYSRYLSYSAEGGRIRVGVRYHDSDYQYPIGCYTIYIYQSFAYVTESLTPGEDLFWDQEYYDAGISTGTWDMNCQEFPLNGTTISTWMGEDWYAYSGSTLTDESINDTSAGCSWWGEEYTGRVILDSRR